MTRKLLFGFMAFVFLALVIGVCACTSTPQVDAAATRSYADPMTENILQAINQNDYPKFSQDFNQKMKDALTQSAFADLKSFLQAKGIGEYQTKQFSKTSVQNGFTVVVYNAKFSNEPADVVVTISFQTVNGKDLVGGFFLNSPKLAAN